MDRMEEFSTLLLGETGTGKGTAAAAIGRSGFIPFDERKGRFAESFAGAFVAINLSQFPEGLIESELFGHRKGAFTGAVEDHEGVLTLSSPHGAIFLDEIGEVSAPVQIKLLQVLQDRVFSPVGSHETRRFQGRVVAATNATLEELRRRGTFRDDFFYRLCSDTITVPPLRQRLAEDPGELDELVAHVLRRVTGTESAEVAGRVREAMEGCLPARYPWPGNVRELEQCIRSVLLTGRYDPDLRAAAPDLRSALLKDMDAGALAEPRAREAAGAHYNLGVARALAGDRESAAEHLRAALDHVPGDRRARRALEALERAGVLEAPDAIEDAEAR
ncbi:MAG: sigma 54-interacting transcriptional regulator [Planctomycetes bacterium]|nr:sigma 54-interacting transcriptional regulator [Planctomycetota bacterium]